MIKNVENIPRPKYLDKILRYKGKGVIKVLIGQRLIGKSCYIRHPLICFVASPDREN